MKIGFYFVFSLLFIAAVVVGVYMINPGTFSFDLFGIHLPMLPIAVWVAIPVAFIVLASVAHMFFHSTKNFFAARKYKADLKKLEDAIYWSLIKEPSNTNFSDNELKKAVALLSESYIEPLSVESSDLSVRLKEVAKVILRINSGEYVNLKMQKFAKHLREGNPLILKNEFNHIDSEKEYALKVVDFKDKYDDSLVEVALDKIVENEDFYTLKKYAKGIGKERFFILMDRVDADDNLGLSIELLKDFIAEYDLDCKEYYKLSLVCHEIFEPDANLSLFKELSSKDEDATSGYLYLLFKYEMLDKAKEVLEEHSADEFKAFRALQTLKKSKYNFKSGDILTLDNICK
ncbi:MAG TPA: hypothetical protein ENL00_01820 [Nitratifractor sp.]|nr:hypothetical protein [Nitratifractor sp.]